MKSKKTVVEVMGCNNDVLLRTKLLPQAGLEPYQWFISIQRKWRDKPAVEIILSY